MKPGLLTPKMRLGDLLIQRGYLTQEGLEAALELQATSESGKLLGEILVEQQFCSEEKILECLAEELRIPYVQLDTRFFDPSIFDVIPREFVEKHTVLPLFRVRNTLTVALAEPTNVFLVDQLRGLTDCDIQLAIASPHDIRRMVQTYMPNTNVFVIDEIIDEAKSDAVELIEDSISDIALSSLDAAGQSPIIRLVNYVLFTAVKEGASDIHIEPTERQLRIRFRVDGALRLALEPPIHLAPAVVSRIKIMANLDISERRLPQDGHIEVKLEGRTVDLRVSTLPLGHGEKVVIRIMDNRKVHLSIESLGFSQEVVDPFLEQLQQPNGIALVTGPTGSGKSTTLYAALNSLASMERNICTVEDPVEFQLPMVNQFQVQEKIGLNFPAVLRSLLRQDPDVLMVGEVRDQETARVAIQAALTGHLVFSSLHTNDAISAVTRLMDMGIEGYLIGATLNMVMAQRLCRSICSRCKTTYEPPKPMLVAMEKMELECSEYFRGVGCRHCRNTGYAGRIAIHELLLVDEGMREILGNNPTHNTIRTYAQDKGMIPLRYDGLRKVREGLTTIEEVVRVSSEGWVPKMYCSRTALVDALTRAKGK